MDQGASSLAKIIAHIESAGDQYALRFEPAVYAEYMKDSSSIDTLLEHISAENVCTRATSQVIASTSFGLYQIMGENLYAQGWHSGKVGAYIANYLAQTVSFSRFLDYRKLPTSWEALRNSPGDLAHFAERYNGSAAYAEKMTAAAHVLGL
jgi:hypothetical protein